MSVNTRKGPIFDPGLCRCCGAIKKCRILNVEYEFNGQKEVYSDMFMDCFGLLLSHLDGEASGRLVCATCVCRLREAHSFRKQVLCCEERLLTRMHGAEGESDEVKLEPRDMMMDEVKEELVNTSTEVECQGYGDAADHQGNDIEDDDLLEEKKPKRKSLRQKLKRNKKSKTKETDSTDAADVSLPNRDEIIGDFQEYILETPVQRRKQNGSRTESSKLNHNVLTIVEYSYVCPFDTSFSDYFCVYCRQVFTEPNDLREHSMTHDPRSFKDVLTNTMNDKKIQLDIYRIDCRLCPEQINDLEHFQRHITTHGIKLTLEKDAYLKFKLTSGTLKCTECDSTFGFFHALRKHMHFGSCICDVCGAHYFTARMLALHQRAHRGGGATYPCRECAKCFKSSYTRHIHVARTHRKEAAYQCSSCDESFFSYALRYRHMCAAHGRRRTFRCDSCPRAYDSRKSLREHTRRAHLDIRKHQCDLCDKRFYLPSRLKEHMASHTGERNFRCERCGKCYPRLRALTVHLQTHAHARCPRVDSGAACLE